jgi:hypothetical protein
MTRAGPAMTKPACRLALLVVLLLSFVCPVSAQEPIEATSESGPVRAVVRITPTEPAIGDPIHLEVEVRAEPEVELLMPEFGEALDRFSIVDFAPSQTVDDDGATLARQLYTLQPSRSGSQSVPPLLIEFVDRREGRDAAPDGEDAYELLTERLDFEVSSALPADAPLDLRPALGSLAPLTTPSAARWLIPLVVVLALALATPLALRVLAAARERKRRHSAYEVARADLDALQYGSRPNAEQMDAFYVRLSDIVRRYLEDHLGLRSPELTTEEFLDELSRSPELVRSHREQLEGFLKTADLVKFAHLVPDDAEVESSIQAAQRFIEETRVIAAATHDVQGADQKVAA